jgi:hypothetical protein
MRNLPTAQGSNYSSPAREKVNSIAAGKTDSAESVQCRRVGIFGGETAGRDGGCGGDFVMEHGEENAQL